MLSPVEKSQFIIGSIAFVFIIALVFLTAFLAVLAVGKNRWMIVAMVIGSFLLGTFVALNHRQCVQWIRDLPIAFSEDVSQYDTFDQQIIAGVFRDPQTLVAAIGAGSYLFAVSVTIWGLLFARQLPPP